MDPASVNNTMQILKIHDNIKNKIFNNKTHECCEFFNNYAKATPHHNEVVWDS